jgi:hypothetical protein
MRHTFRVLYLGSTELADATDENIWEYARKCRDINFPLHGPVTYVLDTDEDSLRSHWRRDSDMTMEDVRKYMTDMGYRFYDTKEAAVAAAEALVARCNQALREVFGTADSEILDYFFPAVA